MMVIAQYTNPPFQIPSLVLDCLNLEDGTNRLSRSVDNKLHLRGE